VARFAAAAARADECETMTKTVQVLDRRDEVGSRSTWRASP
jgi:hypothetical protein